MSTVLDPKLNFAVVTASTGYNAAATSVVLTAGHGARLPQPSTDGAFNLIWFNSTDYASPSEDPYAEAVRVTARSTDTLTVTRAQDSTSATAKNIAGKTYSLVLGLTAKDWNDLDKLAAENRELLTAGGTANALTATPASAWASYTTGRNITVVPAADNTGSATLNVSALGTKTIKNRAGAVLQPGDLKTGIPVRLVYNGTDFIMLSPDVDNRQVAKAWVSFDASSGTPVVGESFNVSSITDNGVGDFTINFTTAFAASTHAAAGMAGNNDASNHLNLDLWGVSGKAAGSCRVSVWSGVGLVDAKHVTAVFFGAR